MTSHLGNFAVQFNPVAASVRFPNARRHLEGGLFISHSGADTEQIRRVIVRLSGTDSRLRAFFSRAGGPAERGAIDSWSKPLSTGPAGSCLS
jgi:hypothetical protein